MLRVRLKHITVCKIDSQWEFSVWLRKLKHRLCINLEGRNGEGDGKEVQKGGDICIPMTGSVKQLSFNKKKIDQGLKHKTCIKILEKYRKRSSGPRAQ